MAHLGSIQSALKIKARRQSSVRLHAGSLASSIQVPRGCKMSDFESLDTEAEYIAFSRRIQNPPTVGVIWHVAVIEDQLAFLECNVSDTKRWIG
jgi:hypothetical protein